MRVLDGGFDGGVLSRISNVEMEFLGYFGLMEGVGKKNPFTLESKRVGGLNYNLIFILRLLRRVSGE